MRNPSVFDPRYFTHLRPTVNSTQIGRVEVFRPTGEHPGWERGVGNLDNAFELVWRSNGRVQPNIDWRARVREFSGEFDATMAVRIQLPIGQNEIGATYDANGAVIQYGPEVEFAMGYVVRVLETPVSGTSDLLNRDYTVRNALPSTNMWLHNLLCDVGTNPNG